MEIVERKPTLRKDGRYMLMVRVAPGPKGRIPAYGRTPEEAAASAAAIEKEYREAAEEARASSALQKYPAGSFAEFLYEVWTPRIYPNLRKTSKRKYDSICVLHLLPALAYTPIAEIGYHETLAMVNGLRRQDGPKAERGKRPLPDRQKAEVIYRFREIMGLYRTLQLATRGEHVRDDWKLVEPPAKPKKKKRTAPEDDFSQQLLAGCQAYEKGPVFAANVLGLRRGEICGLRKDKIDRRALTITVNEQHQPEYGTELVETKGEERTIPITRELLVYLDKFSDPESIYVFTDRKGRPWKPNELSKLVPRICAREELKHTTLHDLRSYAASNLATLGVDVVTIMEILGHTALSTTEIYLNSRDREKRAGLAKALSKVVSEPVREAS